MKSLIRRLFYASELGRLGVGLASFLTGRTSRLGLSHLMSYREADEHGPLQRDEALLLFALTRVIQPKLVVEFGFFHGHSAFNFLRALPEGGRIVSFDVAPDAIRRARSEFARFSQLRVLEKSQAEFDPADLDGEKADLAFIDASHDLALNQETFRRLLPALSDEAIVAVHDTGVWDRRLFLPVHRRAVERKGERWLTPDLYQHEIDERRFVAWIYDEYPEFSQIHLHTTKVIRHGLTLLQRRQRLETAPRP